MTMTRRASCRRPQAWRIAPAFGGARAGAAPLPREADIVVIGAGAAGIAAARRIMAANRKVIVVEASSQIGGRCQTDTSTFDVPFDRGARWMHNPDTNPMIKLARAAGLDVATAPSGQKIRIGRRNARAGETEEFLATLVRANRAIDEAARAVRRLLRVGAAEGSRRLGRHRGFRARRQLRRQGSEGSLRRSTSRARRTATPRSAAGRASAR